MRQRRLAHAHVAGQAPVRLGGEHRIVPVEPARQAGEKFEDDGTGAEKVVAFLEQLKVV